MISQERKLPLDHQPINSMEGVCYLVGFSGAILAVGERNWNDSAAASKSLHLDAGGLIGASIFDFIAGEEVVFAYRRHLWDFQKGRQRAFAFQFRCDAPTLRREMQMRLTTIWDEGRPTAVLFQSLVVAERKRSRINLFDPEYMKQVQAAEALLPLLTVCSFCHDIKRRAETSNWQSLEAYFKSGGSDRVKIGHGMCPKCFERHRSYE